MFSLIVIHIARKSALSNPVNDQSPAWQDTPAVGAAINTKGHRRAMDLEMHPSAMTDSDGEGIIGVQREAAQYGHSTELASTEDTS